MAHRGPGGKGRGDSWEEEGVIVCHGATLGGNKRLTATQSPPLSLGT